MNGRRKPVSTEKEKYVAENIRMTTKEFDG